MKLSELEKRLKKEVKCQRIQQEKVLIIDP